MSKEIMIKHIGTLIQNKPVYTTDLERVADYVIEHSQNEIGAVRQEMQTWIDKFNNINDLYKSVTASKDIAINRISQLESEKQTEAIAFYLFMKEQAVTNDASGFEHLGEDKVLLCYDGPGPKVMTITECYHQFKQK